FILLQRWQAHVRRGGNGPLPVWVQGGIGPNTAAACAAGGAAGVVLDAQLLLARESLLSPDARRRLAAFDGSETQCLGESVSDTAAFAEAVAGGGALPFLALALMRQAEVEPLLKETRARLGDRSWGVGILGFVPAELRQEQIAAIRAHRPPFALIAGGRPDQARELESEGIPTYLHVPSPALLRLFLRDGARAFVFEGRECGGH